MVAKIGKQLVKRRETASISEAQVSKAGRAGIVVVIGLIFLLLAAATGLGIFGTIGAIAFIVGLILLIIALVNGNG